MPVPAFALRAIHVDVPWTTLRVSNRPPTGHLLPTDTQRPTTLFIIRETLNYPMTQLLAYSAPVTVQTIGATAVQCRYYLKPATVSTHRVRRNIFTLDSATFTQNMLQVPCQQGPILGFDWVKDQLEKLGLSNIRRVKECYWMRNGYRRYLAPFHYCREVGLEKLFYGGGHVKVIADKAL